MHENDFDRERLIRYWIESSDDDLDTMMAMFDKQKFNWALFIGHLMIEKLLKALYVKTKKNYPPLIHNLLRLAEMSDLKLTDEQQFFFVTVTAFNINARYDDYKKSFLKKCTLEYTIVWLEKLKENQLWIKKLLLQ